MMGVVLREFVGRMSARAPEKFALNRQNNDETTMAYFNRCRSPELIVLTPDRANCLIEEVEALELSPKVRHCRSGEFGTGL